MNCRAFWRARRKSWPTRHSIMPYRIITTCSSSRTEWYKWCRAVHAPSSTSARYSRRTLRSVFGASRKSTGWAKRLCLRPGWPNSIAFWKVLVTRTPNGLPGCNSSLWTRSWYCRRSSCTTCFSRYSASRSSSTSFCSTPSCWTQPTNRLPPSGGSWTVAYRKSTRWRRYCDGRLSYLSFRLLFLYTCTYTLMLFHFGHGYVLFVVFVPSISLWDIFHRSLLLVQFLNADRSFSIPRTASSCPGSFWKRWSRSTSRSSSRLSTC